MISPVTVGWVVFIAVPLVLWAFGAWANRGHGFVACALAFVVGSDNRLSLSRLQAFAWTLVIFGSYAAAMSIHKPIKSATEEEIKTANDKAKAAADYAAAKKTDYQSAKADATAAEAADNAAQEAEKGAKDEADFWAGKLQPPPTDKDLAAKLAAKNNAAQSALLDAQAKAVHPHAVLVADQARLQAAKSSSKLADDDGQAAQARIPKSAWVQIPAALLALAGIAIGSGVFSSLIAATGGEGQTAGVTGLAVQNFIAVGGAAAQAQLPQGVSVLNPPQQPHSLIIQGTGLGDGGRVRFGTGAVSKQPAQVIYWKRDGTEIAVDVPDQNQAVYDKLVVDTPNGKLTYRLGAQHPHLLLGHAIVNYEWADLFRDDKNPENLSLMKFQMFGWTVIAIAIYVYLLLHGNLTPDTQTLPVVDPSIVTLTGVSQAGYLTGKGVSNVGASSA